jgi:outer membrane receptor protein involved in Fe transport
LALTLDGRFDWVETLDGRRTETNLRTGASLEQVLVDSKTETAFSPNLGLVYEVSPAVQVRASAYSGFRAGTPAELFITNTATSKTAANPNLKPERLLGIESGVDYSPSTRLTTRATVYWNQGEDLIERIFIGTAPPGGAVIPPCGFLIAGGQCRERQNLNEVRTYGIEIDQDVRFATYWRARLTGTLLDTEVTESPAEPALVGNRVPRTPNEAGSLTLEYLNGRWVLVQARVRYIGDRFDDAPNVDPLPERTLVDLTVSRDVTKSFQVFATAQNVFDERELTDISATTGNELNAPRLLQVGVRFRSR